MKYLVHFTAYDSHYPNPNIFHETLVVSVKDIKKIGIKEGIARNIRQKRGFTSVVIDSWEQTE
jgi:hypothetical protein